MRQNRSRVAGQENYKLVMFQGIHRADAVASYRHSPLNLDPKALRHFETELERTECWYLKNPA